MITSASPPSPNLYPLENMVDGLDLRKACQTLLDNYRPIQLPDLSRNRVHHDVEIQETHIFFDLSSFHSVDLDALILAAYSTILGLYCGVIDVLIGLTDLSGMVFPVRLRWDDQTTWEFAVQSARSAINHSLSLRIPLSLVQKTLELKDGQCPFLAFFGHSPRLDQLLPTTTPLLLFQQKDSQLSFFFTTTRMHISVVSTLLQQIASMAKQATIDRARKIIAPFPLSAELSSAIEALPQEIKISRYSQLAPVSIATDFILPYVESTPNSTAVCWYPSLSHSPVKFSSLSYIVLHHNANRFARFLLHLGLRSEDRVAVCMDRDLEFHSVLFGILRAGGCYVPIDPELPAERKVYIAKDSEARFVITSSRLSSTFGDMSVDIEDPPTREVFSTMSNADLNVAFPSGLAFMLYTSGTTGNPKGCLLTHEGLSEVLLALSYFSANVRMENIRDGRYLAIASIAFDVHLAEIFTPLALGMTLISARRSELLENLPHHLSSLQITHVGLVPSLIDATMGGAENGSSLRYIASGGEKITDAILDKWGNHPKVRIANFYGPSEVTIGCCARFVDENTPKDNVGPPFANVSSYVVDRDMATIPRGAVGELVVTGPLVGRGYHRLPDLTAAVFLKWPQPSSWAYRTGDLARMLPDGTLDIIGRIDTQIKLRGVRIEVEGITAVLRRASRTVLQPPLALEAETVLAYHPLITGGTTPQLVSFVAWDSEVPVSIRRSAKPHIIPFAEGLFKALQDGCEKGLASYMRPAHIIPLSWLPLNANGKADSKALVTIFNESDFNVLIRLSQSSTADISNESLGVVVHKLVLLLLQRLKLEPGLLDINANLFGYGVDSLSLTQIASDVRGAFGISISIADIMKNPTVVSISALLKSASPHTPRVLGHIEKFSKEWLLPVKEAVSPMPIERIRPPFPIQAGVLYYSNFSPTSCVQHVIIKILDSVTFDQVRRAWHKTMEQLDILRTVFFFGRELVQLVLPFEGYRLPWSEKTSLVEDDAAFCTYFFTEEAASLAEDITRSCTTIPLFRLTAYSRQENQRLVLSIHHSLFDGISLPLILKSVDDNILGRPSEFVLKADEILEYMHGSEHGLAHNFWTSQFSGFEWSTYSLIETSPSARTRKRTVRITQALSTIHKLALPHKVTIQAALTCTFAILLSQHIYKRDDIVFGVIRSGRLLPVDEIESVPYPTLTILPARVRLGLEGCLQRIQEDISAAVSFEHLSLSTVQNWIRPGSALFDALFAVTVEAETEYKVCEILQSEIPRPDFPLSVEVLLNFREDTLDIRAAYYEGPLVSPVNHILSEFESLLLNILEHGTTAVPTITMEGDLNHVTPSSEVCKIDGVEEDKVALPEPINIDLKPLQRIVSDFLGVEQEHVYPTVSLFSLGLDSIKSIALARLLRQHGFNVTATDILRRPSLQKIDVFIQSSHHRHQEEADVNNEFFSGQLKILEKYANLSSYKLCASDEVTLFPTTALQAGMLSQTVASSGQLYFHAFVLTLDTAVDLDRLHEAWHFVMNHLDILRTTFHYIPDIETWVQAHHSLVQLDWAEYTNSAAGPLQESIQAIMGTLEPKDEFTFEKPPMHLRLLREGSGIHLVLLIHHALYDGLSVNKLLECVQQVYLQNTVSISVQFFDLLPRILLQQRLATAYWMKRLRHHRPIKFPRRTEAGPPSAIISTRMILVARQQINEFLNDTGVTLQCLGQAVWARFLAVLTSSPDVVFGHVVSGRSFDGAEDVIGPMLNTVPFRVEFVPHMSNRDLVQQIHRNNLDALSWQHVSLRVVQNKISLRNIFHSLFLFMSTIPRSSGGIWKLRDTEEFGAHIQYPMNIEFYEEDEGLSVKLACLSTIMDQQELSAAAKRLEDTLKDIIYHPDRIATLDIPVTVAGESTETATDGQSSPVLSPPIPAKLAATLSSILHCPPETLEPTQSLIAIGIDSITAISLSAKLREAGLGISVADIISSKSLGELAAKGKVISTEMGGSVHDILSMQVSHKEHEKVVNRFPAEMRPLITSVIRATEGMKWLIGAWQRSGRTRFQHAFAFDISHNVDLGSIRRAWKALIAYHPILRSTFACSRGSGEPRIVIFSQNLQVPLEEERMDESSDDLRYLDDRMKAIISTPLPATVPQTKGVLLVSQHKTYLILRLHHFQYDAISLSLLLDDLSLLFQGLSPQSVANMGPFLSAFTPSPSHILEQKAYWQSAIPTPFLKDYFPSLISEGTREPSLQRTIVTVHAAFRGVRLLEQVAKSLALSLSVVLLACWASVQSMYTSRKTVTFGLWQAGRTGSVQHIDRLAFPCINILPIHVNIQDDVAQVARYLQEDLHKRTPVIQQTRLEDVDDWVTKGQRTPLTNIFVNVFRISQAPTDTKFIETLQTDYTVPQIPPVFEESVMEELAITKLIKDDILIDIAIHESHDTIAMSVESTHELMDRDHAMELIKNWTSTLERFLSTDVNNL